jgi:hypothetical protein
MELRQDASQKKRQGKSTNEFLPVVTAVTESHEGSGEDLQPSKKSTDPAGRMILEEPSDSQHNQESDAKSEKGGEEEADDYFFPADPQENRGPCRCQSGSS